jgi:hypothetical protein
LSQPCSAPIGAPAPDVRQKRPRRPARAENGDP